MSLEKLLQLNTVKPPAVEVNSDFFCILLQPSLVGCFVFLHVAKTLISDLLDAAGDWKLEAHLQCKFSEVLGCFGLFSVVFRVLRYADGPYRQRSQYFMVQICLFLLQSLQFLKCYQFGFRIAVFNTHFRNSFYKLIQNILYLNRIDSTKVTPRNHIRHHSEHIGYSCRPAMQAELLQKSQRLITSISLIEFDELFRIQADGRQIIWYDVLKCLFDETLVFTNMFLEKLQFFEKGNPHFEWTLMIESKFIVLFPTLRTQIRQSCSKLRGLSYLLVPIQRIGFDYCEDADHFAGQSHKVVAQFLGIR